MGYTHYWEGFTTLPKEAVTAIQKLVADHSHLVQYECDIKSAPAVVGAEVRFNGIGSDGHETFCLSGAAWNFCKTARKPYDKVVVAVLFIVESACQGFTWSSDGDAGDHAEGLALAQQYWAGASAK